MNKVSFKSITILFFALLAGAAAESKDLTHRMGVGVKNNSVESVPSLAAIYYIDKNYAVTSGVGFDTKKDYSKLQANAGLRKMIYFEDHLNFYMGGQLGILNAENPTDGKKTGIELLAVFGCEFFFTGLDNLGLSVEGGLGMSTLNSTRVRTVADDPFRAGIVFYF